MGSESTDGNLASERHQARIAEAARAGMDTAGLFEMIATQFEIEASEGNFTPARHALFATMLAQLERCIDANPDDLAGMLSTTARLKAMMPVVAEARQTPSRRATSPSVVAGSYQEVLLAKFKRLTAWLGQQATAMNRGEYTDEALNDLYILRSGEIETAILGAGDDASARGVERELVRRFALEVQDTALAEHLTIAAPIWPTPSVARNVNGIFYSGYGDTLELLHQAVETIDVGLSVMPQTIYGNPAEYRWNQMRAAALCVFDMTRYHLGGAGDDMHVKIQARVGYELGIALTLGRPILVLADPSRPLPFDIDVAPVLLRGDGSDMVTLMSALDDGIYGVQRAGGENSLMATRAQARTLLSKHANADVRLITKHAFGDGRPDARHLRNVLDSVVGMIGRDAPFLLTPAWAGDYPTDAQRRCFHVTPFGPKWADSVRDRVQESCRRAEASVDYIRGDSVLDADIIRSIWNEICRATHVVVDVTGLNVNALMELGMAHTLGRHVLLITQDADFNAYPTSLRKQRFHHYSLTPEGQRALGKTLVRFFDGHDDQVADEGLVSSAGFDRTWLPAESDPSSGTGTAVRGDVARDRARRDKAKRDKAQREEVQRATSASVLLSNGSRVPGEAGIETPSVTLSCPEALSIGAHIENVLQQAEGDGSAPLRAHAATLGIDMDANRIEDVRAYIDCVPACVEGLHRAASLHDQLAIVQPALSAIEGYFNETNDLVDDRQGLLGLLDDCFMAYVFIDELNDGFMLQQDRPLLDMNLTAMNLSMEPLLTDALVATIREHVRSTVAQSVMARQLTTAGTWLLGGLAAIVAWNVLGGSSGRASSESDRALALLDKSLDHNMFRAFNSD